jgi:hypothetical protein
LLSAYPPLVGRYFLSVKISDSGFFSGAGSPQWWQVQPFRDWRGQGDVRIVFTASRQINLSAHIAGTSTFSRNKAIEAAHQTCEGLKG